MAELKQDTGTRTETFRLKFIGCCYPERMVKQLKQLDGFVGMGYDKATDRVTVRCEPDKPSRQAIEAAIERAGYRIWGKRYEDADPIRALLKAFRRR
ncbi:MAG: heavy-metal-associated domain-containing protein [Candidatus Bipolaricaulia bacterium]